MRGGLAIALLAWTASSGCESRRQAESAKLSAQRSASQREIAQLRERLGRVESALSASEQRNRTLDGALDSLQTSLGAYLESRRVDSVAAVGRLRPGGFTEGGRPEPPASDRSLAITEQFRTVRATLTALEPLRGGGIRVTIRLENTDTQHGAAVAHRAEGSDGIADYWKFFATPIGIATDNRGNRFSLSKESPLGMARDANDWLVLKRGEAATQTLMFEGSSGGIGDTFTVSVDLHIATGLNERPEVGRWSLVFSNIRP